MGNFDRKKRQEYVMETRSFSSILSRTMDVLFRTEQTPRPLRDQCLDASAGMTLRAVWKEFASQLDGPAAKNPSYFLRSTEEELRQWSACLTLDLRFQLLEATAKLVTCF